MYADGNMLKIKHDVLYEVAKLAFAGELEEKRDNIAMELIPGPTPQFRCCIYKEREIIRLWYIERKSKEEIAGAVSYASTRSVYDLRNTAVARFALLYFGAAALPSV